MTPPVGGRKVLYCSPGYAMRINELDPEPRLMKRCQVVADRVFDESFRRSSLASAAAVQ